MSRSRHGVDPGGWLGIVAGAAVFVAALTVPLDDPALLLALVLALLSGRLALDTEGRSQSGADIEFFSTVEDADRWLGLE